MGPNMLVNFSIELTYAIIAIVFCSYVFLKTKEIYDLTKHKGIQYFRDSFLFFGLSFLTRVIFTGITLTTIVNSEPILFGVRPKPFYDPFKLDFMIFAYALMAYFSTMAILSLASSTFTKKIKTKYFDIIKNVFAIFVTLFVIITRSNGLLVLVQLATIFTITIVAFIKHNKKTKKNKITLFTIYGLMFIFWTLNTILINPNPRFIHIRGLKLLSYIISIIVLFIIAYKVKNKLK